MKSFKNVNATLNAVFPTCWELKFGLAIISIRHAGAMTLWMLVGQPLSRSTTLAQTEKSHHMLFIGPKGWIPIT